MEKILVVDDQIPSRQIIVRRLTSEGYSCEEAADGQAALKKLVIETPFDGVLRN